MTSKTNSPRHFFISRHTGALEWLNLHQPNCTEVIAHLGNVHFIHPGDCIYGILPVNLIAAICAAGGRYFHLCVDIPQHQRGIELSCAQLISLGACLQEYYATGPLQGGMFNCPCPDCSS
jgi:CRISPR-associated protein Csx16